MAKPKKSKNGTFTLMVSHQRQRTNLTLGKISRREANAFAVTIDRIIDSRRHGDKRLPPDLQAWMECRNEKHLQQLSRIGLIEYRSANITIGELFEAFQQSYEQRNDIADSTKVKVRSTLKNRAGRIKRFKVSELEPVQRSHRLNAAPILTKQAEKILNQFNSWQRNYCSVATWSRDNKLFSSIGIWAVKQGYCDFNPFASLPSRSMVNQERNYYIDREKVVDAMEACLSPDIRLTLAMGRFAGLRTCSEVRTMKWSHVDFAEGVLTIIDSKSKKPRVMPLFDDVRAELVRQQSVTGTTRFVASETLRSSSKANNYVQVREAIKRSGQDLWPRVRQNLRTSAENDLLSHFTEREVTQWIGHSVTVSRKHYQKSRPGDYQLAIEKLRSI